KPDPTISRWRQRLQDAMLDSHFSLGQTRFLLAGEPDHLAGLAAALGEAGGRVETAIAAVKSKQLDNIKANKVLVGDLGDAETGIDDCDLIIGNCHCEALAHNHHKGLMLRGYPNWEQIGHQLKNDVLYEGGCYLLFEAANTATEFRERH
nr:nitrogenase iron-molybdenum cofactor biosynthesis protein NifN [Desulfuromonadales bacterium]